MQPATTNATEPRWQRTPSGRVQDLQATEGQRVVAAVMHLWPLAIAVAGPVAPLLPVVLWLCFRGSRPFVDDHGREVLNSQCTMIVLLLVPCAGWAALVVWLPVWIVSIVRGAVAAGGGELFRYPALLRALR